MIKYKTISEPEKKPRKDAKTHITLPSGSNMRWAYTSMCGVLFWKVYVVSVDSPVTCKHCLKAMERVAEDLRKEIA